MLLFIQVQHNLLLYINQLNFGFLKIRNKNDARILRKRVNARAGKSRDFVANTKLWCIGAKKRVTFVLLVRKSEKFIDEAKNDTKNYAHCLWGCPTAQLFPCDDNFPPIFPLIYFNPIASCNGIQKSGISNPINDWNPESSTWNPESTAWNPESKFILDSFTWGEKS